LAHFPNVFDKNFRRKADYLRVILCSGLTKACYEGVQLFAVKFIFQGVYCVLLTVLIVCDLCTLLACLLLIVQRSSVVKAYVQRRFNFVRSPPVW